MDPMSGSGGMMGGFNPSYQGGPQAGAMMGGGMPPQTSFMPNQGTGQPAPQYTSNPQRYGLVFFSLVLFVVVVKYFSLIAGWS